MVSNESSSALNSDQDLTSIPTAQGGLSRLAIARLKTAGVPVVPLLRRVGLTPEVIADPEASAWSRPGAYQAPQSAWNDDLSTAEKPVEPSERLPSAEKHLWFAAAPKGTSATELVERS